MEDDHGSHEEMYGGRMLPENKQVLDQLYDPKQSQGEFTGRALRDLASRCHTKLLLSVTPGSAGDGR